MAGAGKRLRRLGTPVGSGVPSFLVFTMIWSNEMRLRSYTGLAALSLIAVFMSVPCFATVFSSLHGVIHDAQHFPIKGAAVTLRASDSDFELKATTGVDGAFDLNDVPIGVYRIRIEANGFAEVDDTITVLSGTRSVLHFALPVATVKTTVSVSASQDAADTVTPTTLVSRQDIDQTPGASRTIGTEMITDYVPGAYMTHDMLHMRGGHQTAWLLDGIAIPNTKIASNVGPQIDPKDIDQLEVQRGSYDSEIGDRTYGVFNVLTAQRI
jgi:hypothetical protein